MKIHKSIDLGFLIPIGIGFLSLAGLGLLFLITQGDTPGTAPSATHTATSFKYFFLGTGTHTPKPTLKAGATTATFTGETSDDTAFISPTLELTPSTPDTLRSNPASTLTITPTAEQDLSFTAGKYDDTDERIVYDGDWVNDLLDTAYEETLFFSTLVGDTASFTFTGKQLQIGYLEEPTLGTITVTIDGTDYPFDQSTGTELSSPELPPGTHSALLTHKSGDLILLDYIVIIGSP